MVSPVPKYLSLFLIGSYLVLASSYSMVAQEALTLEISPEKPFFDDFSLQTDLPDSLLWFIDSASYRTPNISLHMAQNPPSWGVLTFEGSDATGIPYNTQTISSGIADELTSQRIDLSPYSPADQLMLSFFLQPQGLGNAPESADAFQVLCTRVDQDPDSLDLLLSIPGSASAPFRQYKLLLDDPAYFHEAFQLTFRSIGSLNGALDHWHLDYVFLGLNRSPNDTTYQDQSLQDFSLTILDPYTLYPAAFFPPPSTGNSVFSARVNNLSLQAAQVGTQLILTEPSQNTLQFGQELEVFPYQANTLEVVLRDALSPFSGSFGSLDVNIQLTGAGNQPANDFLQFSYRVDSLMGYDDGEADASYGLTRAKGFGIQYTLPAQANASLSAVWISFSPRLDVSPSSGSAEYLDEKGFQWVIWDAAHPDSVLLRQSGVRVNYGASPNHFQRYGLAENIPLPDTFWLGIEQIDGVPIGVGLDRNAVSGQLYWDSAGVWTPSRIAGVPMIRAEIGGDDFLPTSFSPSLSPSSLHVYPNPLSGQSFFVQLPSPIRQGHIELWNLSGKKVWQQQVGQVADKTLSISLMEKFPSGVYLLQGKVLLPGGGEAYFSHKLLIN